MLARHVRACVHAGACKSVRAYSDTLVHTRTRTRTRTITRKQVKPELDFAILASVLAFLYKLTS
jgi:hypothetical protein